MVDKAVFDAHIEEWMQDGARQIFFTQERYNWILSFLQGDEEVSARLTPAEKQYARRFNIQRVPTDVAFREVLYMDKKVKNKGDFNTEVVTYDRIHAILVSAHCIGVKHAGETKTSRFIARTYTGIPRRAITLFCQMCGPCNTNKPAFPRAVRRPIKAEKVFERWQVDCIDMQAYQFEDFKWILHIKDHNSKYSWAFACKRKTMAEIVPKILSVMYRFGPPRILQSDNGKEFVNSLIFELQKQWVGLQLVRGRPRSPQTQGF